MSTKYCNPIAVGTIQNRLPFVRKFIEAGIIPPLTKDFSIHFPLDDLVTVTYNCFAPEELVAEDVAIEIVQDIGLVGANMDDEPAGEVSDAPV